MELSAIQLNDKQRKAIFNSMRILDALKWGLDYNTVERSACLEVVHCLIEAFPDVRFEASPTPAWSKLILKEIKDLSVKKY